MRARGCEPPSSRSARRRDLRVAAARATLQTRLRLAGQHRSAAFLAAGWQRLPDALAKRWQATESRRAWVAAIVAQARSAMPKAALRIAHPPDWPSDERDALAAARRGRFREPADARSRSVDCGRSSHHLRRQRRRRHLRRALRGSRRNRRAAAARAGTHASQGGRVSRASIRWVAGPVRPGHRRGAVRAARSGRGGPRRAAGRSRPHRRRRDRRAGL